MNSFNTGSANATGIPIPAKGSWKKTVLPLTLCVVVSFLLLSSVPILIDLYQRLFPPPPRPSPMFIALETMFPGMTDVMGHKNIFTIKQADKTIGYAFIATGKGYGGPIQILVGLQGTNMIKGVTIVSQTETKGLGSRVELPQFTGQFADKRIEDIRLRSDGGQIDGITGSTISSKAVINAVRETALEKAAQLPRDK